MQLVFQRSAGELGVHNGFLVLNQFGLCAENIRPVENILDQICQQIMSGDAILGADTLGFTENHEGHVRHLHYIVLSHILNQINLKANLIFHLILNIGDSHEGQDAHAHLFRRSGFVQIRCF